MVRAMVALAALGVSSGAALGQASLSGASPAGRYAFEAAECRSGQFFATITDTRIDLPTLSCTGVAYDQTEAGGGTAMWQVNAKACVEEGQTRGKPMRFRISRAANGAIRFHWPDGTASGRMMRCR
jgi:hypothetical protein